MWALGCVLHVLLCGAHPFQDATLQSGQWSLPASLSQQDRPLVAMLCDMLQRLPTQRPTSTQAMRFARLVRDDRGRAAALTNQALAPEAVGAPQPQQPPPPPPPQQQQPQQQPVAGAAAAPGVGGARQALEAAVVEAAVAEAAVATSARAAASAKAAAQGGSAPPPSPAAPHDPTERGGGGGGGGMMCAAAALLRLRITRGVGGGLGFATDKRNLVKQLLSGGQAEADGLLRLGDEVLALNGEPLGDRPLQEVMLPGEASYELIVQRDDPTLATSVQRLLPDSEAAEAAAAGAPLRLLRLRLARGARGLGLDVSGLNVLKRVVPGSAAEATGEWREGDVIVSVNGLELGAAKLVQALPKDTSTYDFGVLRAEARAEARAAPAGESMAAALGDAPFPCLSACDAPPAGAAGSAAGSMALPLGPPARLPAPLAAAGSGDAAAEASPSDATVLAFLLRRAGLTRAHAVRLLEEDTGGVEAETEVAGAEVARAEVAEVAGAEEAECKEEKKEEEKAHDAPVRVAPAVGAAAKADADLGDEGDEDGEGGEVQAAAETRATAPSAAVVPPPVAHADLTEEGDGEGDGDKREGGTTEHSGAASGDGAGRDAGVGAGGAAIVLVPSSSSSTEEWSSSAEMVSAEMASPQQLEMATRIALGGADVEAAKLDSYL